MKIFHYGYYIYILQSTRLAYILVGKRKAQEVTKYMI